MCVCVCFSNSKVFCSEVVVLRRHIGSLSLSLYAWVCVWKEGKGSHWREVGNSLILNGGSCSGALADHLVRSLVHFSSKILSQILNESL